MTQKFSDGIKLHLDTLALRIFLFNHFILKN